MDFKNRDIISIRDFDKDSLIQLLQMAQRMESASNPALLSGQLMATLFFEPSTRTRMSFEAAMVKLGGSVISISDPNTSSSAKGEVLSDSIRIVSGYSDVIVLRHPLEGAARLAADVSDVPVINAGDGSNQHPTQTFLDLYTILKEKQTLDNLKIGFLGDLKYGRTVHSLASALRHFNVELFFISPPLLRLPPYVLDGLSQAGVVSHQVTSVSEVIGLLDILYCTRIQKERFQDPIDYEKVAGGYKLNAQALQEARKDLRIMHPLPRVDELDPELDSTPHALYFSQARNGIPVRQALLAMILGAV